MTSSRRLLIPLLLGLLVVSASIRWWQSTREIEDTLLKFRPPTAQERMAAIGDLRSLSPTLRRAFEPASDFAPMPKPGPRDWLANYHEGGQTFDEFLRFEPLRVSRERPLIYLLPIGDFFGENTPSLDKLREFTEAYFTLQTKLLPRMTIAADQVRTRIREGTVRPQWMASDVLKLLEQQLPADAFCILGVTMTDLYSSTTPSYVFGQASLRNRSGVFSFARFDPAFYDEPRPADAGTLILRRCCHTLAHETCHIVGMQHCIYFACAVNGSNNLDENDSRPLHLCPVCLRKLHESLGFDPVERDRSLVEVYRRFGFANETSWVERRLQTVTAKRVHDVQP